MEAKANERGSDCLKISLILRKIFDYFTSTELLKLSCVSKVWNFEARSVLKQRGNVTGTLSENQPCEDLVAFASDLNGMNIVPFTGITIYFNVLCRVDHKSQGSSVMSPTYSTILDRVHWKHLSLLNAYPDGCEDCPGISLAKKVLECHCETLEELSVHFPNDKGDSFKQIVEHGSFPRLETLKLGALTDSPFSTTYFTFIKTLISRAPNLKEVYTVNGMNFTDNILEGSSAVMHVTRKFSPAYCKYPEIFPALRLKSLILDYFLQNYTSAVFNMNIPVLLKSSQFTLTSLTIDLVIAVPLMTYGICLENVIELTMIMNKQSSELVRPFLTAFDFKRLFPILNLVHIYCQQCRNPISEELIGDFIEKGQAVLNDTPAPDRSIHIKHLHFCRPMEDSDDFMFFAGIFPHVEKISVRERNHPQVQKGPIFENWKGLKELKVLTDIDYPHLPHIRNLDSVFCGIFPEEVEELRGKDDEYLKAVQIVPVMPSIACMRDLRTLTLDYIDPLYHLVENDYGRLSDEMGCDPTFIFSKVAGLTAFARCENLYVTFRTNIFEIYEGLDHMCPYAAVDMEPCEIIDPQ